MNRRLAVALVWTALAALLVGVPGNDPAQGKAPVDSQPSKAPPHRQAWTLDEAQAQLKLYPRDPFLQYVALQLAQREGDVNATADQLMNLLGEEARQEERGRANGADLFSMFTGALAVQESLQLDTMRGASQRPKLSPEEQKQLKEVVKVADLDGPTIKSHPWEEMLAGKKPDVSPLAHDVPEDFYFIEFRSLNKLVEATEISDLWGTHLLNQSSREARTQQVGNRVKDQLAIETNRLLRPVYDLVVEEVAVAGSDLFLREGSDLTLLFRIKQPEVFKTRMDGFLTNAEKAHAGAKRTEAKYRGVAYVHVGTPDRTLNVFSAYPAPGLHVRSNSRVAFERILDAIEGKQADGKPVRRLGDSTEFKYIRTLMPRGAKEEDGFVYLSDPFIRRLVGPELKLTERRRMLCYNHLKMIGHASMLYRSEHGRMPESLDVLHKTGCCPEKFNEGTLTCPDGGTYTLSADGMTGVCSHHGQEHFLTPCCEIPVAEVNGAEAAEYKAFLTGYNQYWRTYFDPIALRLQLTPEHYRLETIVLPLIDNTIYTTLARAAGGKPEPLDALPVPKRNIFSVNVRLNKDELLKEAGEAGFDADAKLLRDLGLPADEVNKLDVHKFVTEGLGNQVGLHIYDAVPTFDFNLPGFLGEMLGSFNGGRGFWRDPETIAIVSLVVSSLNSPVYVSLPVKDAKIVDEFLGVMDKVIAVQAREKSRGGFILDRVEYDFYKLPQTGATPFRGYAVRFGPFKFRFFWARIGDGLYIASKSFILEDILAAEKAQGEGKSHGHPGPEGHAMVRVRRSLGSRAGGLPPGLGREQPGGLFEQPRPALQRGPGADRDGDGQAGRRLDLGDLQVGRQAARRPLLLSGGRRIRPVRRRQELQVQRPRHRPGAAAAGGAAGASAWVSCCKSSPARRPR